MGKAIWGGLLSGIGAGVVSQAEQMRKDALERAKMLQRTQERAEDRQWRQEDMKATQEFKKGLAQDAREFQMERDETRWKREQEEARKRRGQAANQAEIDDMDKQAERERLENSFRGATTYQGEDGNWYQINDAGKTRQLPGTPTSKGQSSADGITQNEERTIALFGGDLVERDSMTGKIIGIKDPQALAAKLDQQGYSRLAAKIAPQGQAAKIEPAPRDPAQRVVGQQYEAPDGRKVTWTGSQWQVSE